MLIRRTAEWVSARSASSLVISPTPSTYATASGESGSGGSRLRRPTWRTPDAWNSVAWRRVPLVLCELGREGASGFLLAVGSASPPRSCPETDLGPCVVDRLLE